MHAVSFTGDLKDYLLKLDLLRRKLNGSFVFPYSTLLHIVKNACIHAHQMEIKHADKIANKNFDTFLTEMRATAQDLATYAKSSSTAKAFVASANTTNLSTAQQSANQKSARGRGKSTHGTPVVECFFCKKSGHTFEKCRAMLASQKTYTEAQAQYRKSATTARLAIMDTTAISDTTDKTDLHDRQLFDEFIAFKAFTAPSSNQSTQPPDAYSARAFMASAQVNYNCTDLSPGTNYSGRTIDRFIIAASPARALLPSGSEK